MKKKAIQFDTFARNCAVGAQVHLHDQGLAVFEVTGKTQLDPADNVEVDLVSDPHGEARFKSGDCAGGEAVHIITK